LLRVLNYGNGLIEIFDQSLPIKSKLTVMIGWIISIPWIS